MRIGASDSTNFLLESWLDFRGALEEHPEIRRLLFDNVTGLPTAPLLFPRIQMLLEERGEVSLLAVNVVRYSKIEEIYGWKVFDVVMREVAESLERITGSALRDSDIIAELMISGNSFVVVLSPPRDSETMQAEDLIKITGRVEQSIREDLVGMVDPALFSKFGCYAGAATIHSDPNVRLERLVHDGLERALANSGSREAADALERATHLKEIIQNEDVHTLMQPIVDLVERKVIGYEALTRGPEGSEFERPDKLFKVAYDSDLVLRLERLCRKTALESAVGWAPDRLLFLNIEPDAVADPQLREIMSTSLLTSELTPSRIVLEITERSAITDFSSIRSTLEFLRALGYRVAVDDAGAGYGSLQCLAEVHPEWLKVDLSLVRGCDADPVRLQLIRCLVSFADRMDVHMIAEGIETTEELAALRSIGVRYGQGFYFCRPVAAFPDDEDIQGL
ncbi:MAG: GGDEF domain-containing phosphodiesterase [Actinomycetota bacterium]|jgi:EAL domain-containing protein (putative c-di-GMP-specific phosphodiesterase class I)|nr:GGDEF domain-containing phosphodiesterase [Actinomycetota bacterium]